MASYSRSDGSINFMAYASLLLEQHDTVVLADVVRTIQTNYNGMESWNRFCRDNRMRQSDPECAPADYWRPFFSGS